MDAKANGVGIKATRYNTVYITDSQSVQVQMGGLPKFAQLLVLDIYLSTLLQSSAVVRSLQVV